MKIQVTVFWNVTSCIDAVGYKRFGGPSSPSAFRVKGGWKHRDPPKRWHPTSLHGVKTQKTVIWHLF